MISFLVFAGPSNNKLPLWVQTLVRQWMVSSPSFKPNAFVHGLDKKYWDSLIKDEKKPLTNKGS